MPIRLQKILSTAGIASRRAAEELITQGRVSVNGQTVTELGSKADLETDEIRVDGRRVKSPHRRLYLLMYKPRGYITSRSDPQRRPTVIDLLSTGGVRDYVYPVGRLDYESEGLLLLTSDGDLAAGLTHPRHGVAREYHVRVRGVPDGRTLERLAKGIVIDGRRTAPTEVAVIGKGDEGAYTTLSMVIHEGRNRQVRKMCEAVGHLVLRLRRVRIGPITDDHIRPGEFRELTDREVAALKRLSLAVPTSRPSGSVAEPRTDVAVRAKKKPARPAGRPARAMRSRSEGGRTKPSQPPRGRARTQRRPPSR